MLFLLSFALAKRMSCCSHDLPISGLDRSFGGGGLCSLFSFVTFLQQTELSHLETVNIKKNLIVLFCLIWISLFIKM